MIHDIPTYSQNGFYVFCQESHLWKTRREQRTLREKIEKENFDADWMNIRSADFQMDRAAGLRGMTIGFFVCSFTLLLWGVKLKLPIEHRK